MEMIVRVRRGTTSQWASSTKVLLVGEIGLDTTLNKIKFGNGSDLWPALPFANVTPAELKELTQDYVSEAILAGTHSHISITYDDQANTFSFSTSPEVVISSSLSNTLGDYLTTSAFNAQLDTAGGTPTLDNDGYIRDAEISSVIARSNSQTFTGNIVLPSTTSIGDVSATEIGYIDGLTSNAQSQINSKAPSANPTFTGTVSGITKSMVGLSNVDNTSDANKPVSTATQTALDLKAPKADATFTGTTNVNDLTIGGTLTFNGTATTINSNNLSISDPLIYMGTGNSANSVDLGIVTHFNNGTYQHSGLVRDHNDGKWKLFSGITDEPTTVMNFSQATYDTLKLGSLEITGTATGITKTMVGLGNVDNTSDETKFKNEYVTDSTTSRTISSTTDKFKVIEFTNSGAIAVNIPNDTQDSGWPIGASVEIRQAGTGQITVGKDAAVTLNSPEGQVKTRVQWSSILLEKRAANSWLLTGDITA